MSEERELPLVPDRPVETEPLAIVEPAAQEAALVAELERAGVILGAYERGTVEWLCQRPGWGWGTVATIASWVRRAASKDVPALLAEGPRPKWIMRRVHVHGLLNGVHDRLTSVHGNGPSVHDAGEGVHGGDAGGGERG